MDLAPSVSSHLAAPIKVYVRCIEDPSSVKEGTAFQYILEKSSTDGRKQIDESNKLASH